VIVITSAEDPEQHTEAVVVRSHARTNIYWVLAGAMVYFQTEERFAGNRDLSATISAAINWDFGDQMCWEHTSGRIERLSGEQGERRGFQGENRVAWTSVRDAFAPTGFLPWIIVLPRRLGARHWGYYADIGIDFVRNWVPTIDQYTTDQA
jgi:hypothetical protein